MLRLFKLTMQSKPQIYATQFDFQDGNIVPFSIENVSVVGIFRKEFGLAKRLKE